MATLLSYALTSLADVKETLGIDSGNTSNDNLITRKINQATEMIEAYCELPRGKHFAEATYTDEEYDGQGGRYLVLEMRPVTNVSSFQYRDSVENEDNWTDVESELYFLDEDSGVLDLLFTQTEHPNRYRVSYTAGYATIPADLSEAAVTLASYLYNNDPSGTGVKRQEEGRRRIEYFAPNEKSSIIQQLSIDQTVDRYVMRPLLA